MRLIDADELENDLAEMYEREGWDSKEVHFSLLDVIANNWGRTVKAIPVEWIEKKCREYGLYEHLYRDELLGVQMLLRDWEKENEELV